MSTPSVSIIIPLYNADRYIKTCLNSVLRQTYKDIEIILIDDGSTDTSSKIVDEFAIKDNRISVIHKNNEGASIARNTGIEASNGEYLFFLDADDYLDDYCIEKLVKTAQNGSLATTGYMLYESGVATTPDQCYKHFDSLTEMLDDFDQLFATKLNFVWGKLYKTNIIKENNIRFKKGISLGEDLLFNLEYFACWSGKIDMITHNGYYYRQTGNSSLSKKFDKEMFAWNDYCYNELRKFLIEANSFNSRNKTHLYKNILGNFRYGFYLIAVNKILKRSEKERLIRRYLRIPIYKEASEISEQLRLDYRIFNWLLTHNFVNTYIILENLKLRLKSH